MEFCFEHGTEELLCDQERIVGIVVRTDPRPQTQTKHTHRNHNNKSTQDNTYTQRTHINNIEKQKETILATYKAITRPIFEHVSTI